MRGSYDTVGQSAACVPADCRHNAAVTTGDTGRRGYCSPRRAAQARSTRERIIAAATAGFLTAGYTATTMRSIADAAGVSVPTVELAFGTKASLLKTVVDLTAAGDTEPLAALKQEWARQAHATLGRQEFLDTVGQFITMVSARLCDLLAVVAQAAAVDAEITAMVRQFDERRAVAAEWIVHGIAERTALRPDLTPARAADTVRVLIDPAVFRRLTRDCGWTPEEFRDWWVDSVTRLLTAADRE